MAPTASGLRHDPVLIALHWLTAGLVAALWLIGQTIDFVPNGALRIDYRSLHMVCGVSVALVLVVRLLFRAIKGGMLPPLDHGLARLAARVVHALLYATLAAQRATKILGIFARLNRRDNKPQYLRHLPRLWGYLQRSLAHPGLASLKAWYAANVPAPDGL